MYDMEKIPTGPIVLLINYQKEAVGLNLHKVMRICHLINRPPNGSTGKQALGRQHRKGRVRIVLAFECEVAGRFDNIQAAKNLMKSLSTITALYGAHNYPVAVTDDGGNQSVCPETTDLDDFGAADYVRIDGYIYHKSESSLPHGREEDGEDANVIDSLMPIVRYSRGIAVHVPTAAEAQAVVNKKADTPPSNMAAVQPDVPQPSIPQSVVSHGSDIVAEPNDVHRPHVTQSDVTCQADVTHAAKVAQSDAPTSDKAKPDTTHQEDVAQPDAT